MVIKTCQKLTFETIKQNSLTSFKMSAAKHICDICGTSFSERWMLNITTKHIDFMYGCLYCDKSFSRKEYYEIHVERCSSKTKENLKFDCDQCEKKFDNKRLLARHKRNNHVTEKFTCETCHGTFWSQHTLGNHIRQVHVKK